MQSLIGSRTTLSAKRLQRTFGLTSGSDQTAHIDVKLRHVHRYGRYLHDQRRASRETNVIITCAGSVAPHDLIWIYDDRLYTTPCTYK